MIMIESNIIMFNHVNIELLGNWRQNIYSLHKNSIIFILSWELIIIIFRVQKAAKDKLIFQTTLIEFDVNTTQTTFEKGVEVIQNIHNRNARRIKVEKNWNI